MLGKQEGFRDNFSYPKLEKRYIIVSSLYLHKLHHEVNVIQGLYLTKITNHNILVKIWVGFFLKIEESNQGKVNYILIPDKNVQVKKSETK